MALQFMDEQWRLNAERRASVKTGADDFSESKNCTSFGAADPAGGTTLMGRPGQVQALGLTCVPTLLRCPLVMRWTAPRGI